MLGITDIKSRLRPLAMLYPDKYLFRKIKARLRLPLTFYPEGKPKGRVLLCYLTAPFLFKKREEGHTNHWECSQMVQTFLDMGFAVDVINFRNHRFKPRKKYKMAIDIHDNLERWVPFLPPDCIKVLHITYAHWLPWNQAEYTRLLALKNRRQVALKPQRVLNPTRGIECADVATILGNDCTQSTYRFAQKPLYVIPISTPRLFDFPEQKEFEAQRKNFLWIGGAGLVMKGLDLALEAFAEMPDYHLTVCGYIDNDPDFKRVYHKELYATANIHTLGEVDMTSEGFVKLAAENVALIYPTAAEGQSGAMVACLHAGLIPIATLQAGVDVEGFGSVIKNVAKEEIKSLVKELSALDAAELKRRSKAAWSYAQQHHTREYFAKAYRNFAESFLNDK